MFSNGKEKHCKETDMSKNKKCNTYTRHMHKNSHYEAHITNFTACFTNGCWPFSGLPLYSNLRHDQWLRKKEDQERTCGMPNERLVGAFLSSPSPATPAGAAQGMRLTVNSTVSVTVSPSAYYILNFSPMVSISRKKCFRGYYHYYSCH